MSSSLLVLGTLMACSGHAPFSTAATLPPELTGTWSVRGVLPSDSDDAPPGSGMSWYLHLTLEAGALEVDGYPPWGETATITRVEQDGPTYTLHVTNHTRNGERVDDGVMTVTLSEDGRTLNHLTHAMTKTAPVED